MGRFYTMDDLNDIFQGGYIFQKDEETNGLVIANSGNSIPLNYAEHIKVRNMLNNLINGHGEELEQDLEEKINRRYEEETNCQPYGELKRKDEQHMCRIIEGYVYIVKMGEYYKVGKALDLDRRMGEYTLLPIEPEIVFYKKVNDYTKSEKILHKQYADKRVRGEWFKLDNKDIKLANELI